MGQFNEDLHHRQSAAETGHDILASPDRVVNLGRSRWRPLLFPVLLVGLGFLLAFVGPLPGLGLFLIMGGTVGVMITAVRVVLGADGEMWM
jgi:hypothetical protein